MNKRTIKLYLEDIITFFKRIEEYTKDFEFFINIIIKSGIT